MKKDWYNTKLAIAITANHELFDKTFMWCILNMFKPTEYSILHQGRHIKSNSLNEHVKTASEFGADKILFIDVDMDFPPNVIPKLLSHDVPIVSGLYHGKSHPYPPVAGFRNKHGLAVNGEGKIWKTNYYPLPADQLVEVDWTGIGCLMVDMDVFNKIYFPCFKDKWDNQIGDRAKGHDVIFCEAVKKAGYEVYVDTSIDCGHRESTYINKLWVDTYHRSNFDSMLHKVLKEYTTEPAWWDNAWMENNIRSRGRGSPELLNLILPLIPTGSTFADFGCGDGYILDAVGKKRNAEVYGYDFSPESISYLERRDIKGEVADIRNFVPNKTYHTVTAIHLLEHMVSDNEEHAVQTISDMTENQAFIVVPQEKKLWIEHQRLWDGKSLKKLVKPFFKSVKIHRLGELNKLYTNRHIVAHCKK